MKRLGIMTMFVAIPYLIGAFVTLEPDVRNWHEAGRATLVLAAVFLTGLYWAREGWE